MQIELQSALNFLMTYLYDRLPRRRIYLFAEELEKNLVQKFEGHWYPDKPSKGSGYRCLKFGLTNLDPVVIVSAKSCGVDLQDIRSFIPLDLCIWVDPGEVTYRVGGDRAPLQLLYSYDGTGPSVAVDRSDSPGSWSASPAKSSSSSSSAGSMADGLTPSEELRPCSPSNHQLFTQKPASLTFSSDAFIATKFGSTKVRNFSSAPQFMATPCAAPVDVHSPLTNQQLLFPFQDRSNLPPINQNRPTFFPSSSEDLENFPPRERDLQPIQPPVSRDFPPAQAPISRDFPPAQAPISRDFPPAQAPISRDFPPAQAPVCYSRPEAVTFSADEFISTKFGSTKSRKNARRADTSAMSQDEFHAYMRRHIAQLHSNRQRSMLAVAAANCAAMGGLPAYQFPYSMNKDMVMQALFEQMYLNNKSNDVTEANSMTSSYGESWPLSSYGDGFTYSSEGGVFGSLKNAGGGTNCGWMDVPAPSMPFGSSPHSFGSTQPSWLAPPLVSPPHRAAPAVAPTGPVGLLSAGGATEAPGYGAGPGRLTRNIFDSTQYDTPLHQSIAAVIAN